MITNITYAQSEDVVAVEEVAVEEVEGEAAKGVKGVAEEKVKVLE